MPVMILVLGPCFRYLLGVFYLQRAPEMQVAGDAVYWNTLSHLDAFCMGGLIPVFGLEKKVSKPSVLLGIAFSIALAAGAILNFLALGASGQFLSDRSWV